MVPYFIYYNGLTVDELHFFLNFYKYYKAIKKFLNINSPLKI